MATITSALIDERMRDMDNDQMMEWIDSLENDEREQAYRILEEDFFAFLGGPPPNASSD